jgi:hypothetical protein
MVHCRGAKNCSRNILIAQLVFVSLAAANGDEVRPTKTTCEMRSVAERLSNKRPRRWKRWHRGMTIEVNRRYLKQLVAA